MPAISIVTGANVDAGYFGGVRLTWVRVWGIRVGMPPLRSLEAVGSGASVNSSVDCSGYHESSSCCYVELINIGITPHL